MTVEAKPHMRLVFHHGYEQWWPALPEPPVVPRYNHLIGEAAIDDPPTTAHGWLNRAFALTRWAMMQNNGFLKMILKQQAALALHHARSKQWTRASSTSPSTREGLLLPVSSRPR
jgi:hypothetical protein